MRNILRPSQVWNLDEIGFTPGWDLNSINRTGVVAATNTRAVFPSAQFRYINRISVLVAVFANGVSIYPAAVLHGD